MSALALHTAVRVLERTADKVSMILEVNRLDTAEDARLATELLSAIATVIGDAEDVRKGLKAPHLKAGREVDARFKEPRTRLEKLRDQLKARLAERVKARLLAERAALEEAKEAAAQGDLERTNAALERVPGPEEVSPPTRWTWEVGTVDLYGVPPEFLMLNQAKIREAIKASAPNAPDIPGIVFDRKAIVIARRS